MGDLPGFDPTLILWLNLVGTFVFGISGALAGVRARLDVFGVVVLSAVVGLAGGIIRDLLIGAPPATFRDWRYLAAAGAAGLVVFFGGPLLDRAARTILTFDAMGLALFCVTGASKASDFALGVPQAIILGAITGIGGGMLRDLILGEVPNVLRRELYAIPALLGAGVLVAAHETGNLSPVFPILGAGLCFAVRMAGIRYGIDAPIAPSERRRRATEDQAPLEPEA
jgi:uncharacterized membrane protein YeiH